MFLTSLGTAGWMPSTGRQTSSFLVRSFDRALLLDAGTGVRRLVTNPILLQDIRRVDILISHFHLDHVIGLSYLNALTNIEISIWGPGALLYDISTHDALRRLLSPPFLAFDITDRIAAVQDVPGDRFRVNGFEVAARCQRKHTSPTLAYRINDALVYCTDTEYDPGNIKFANRAQLLLHEAWSATEPVDTGHSTAIEAAEIAKAANVTRLLLVHLPPNRPAHLLRDAARKVFEASDLADEEMTLPLRQ